MAKLVESSSRFSMLGIEILNHPLQEFPKNTVVHFIPTKKGWKYKLQLSKQYLKWCSNQNRIRIQRNRKTDIYDKERIKNNSNRLIMALFKYLSDI